MTKSTKDYGMIKHLLTQITTGGSSLREIFIQNIRPSLGIVPLMILITAIAFPLS